MFKRISMIVVLSAILLLTSFNFLFGDFIHSCHMLVGKQHYATWGPAWCMCSHEEAPYYCVPIGDGDGDGDRRSSVR